MVPGTCIVLLVRSVDSVQAIKVGKVKKIRVHTVPNQAALTFSLDSLYRFVRVTNLSALNLV
jgi:hypothetical protein